MDLLDGLKAFVATAETGSFTDAAERLGISNRLTSKYVAELEQRLGVRLLQRTTRRVGITAAGEELLHRAPSVLADLDAMIATLTDDRRGYSGTLRISAPVTFGEIYVKDLLARFAAPYPDLTIDLRLDDAYADLAAQGIDLAFRIGESSIASLKRRKLGSINTLTVASPDYLATHAAPKTPEDLCHHQCIADTNRQDPLRWVYHDEEGRSHAVTIATRFMVNSAQVVRDLALQGHGIASCPSFVLGDDLETGRLVPLLDGYRGPTLLVSAVYLEGRTLSRKVRALIDFALEDARTRAAVHPLQEREPRRDT